MKGRPLAKSGYEQELASIRGFIAMQNKADSGVASAAASSDKVCNAKALYSVTHSDEV